MEPPQAQQALSFMRTITGQHLGVAGPQNPQAECCYLAGRCRRAGQAGCGHRAQGGHLAGRSQWRALGSLQEKGQVRDSQEAKVDLDVPLAESLESPSFVSEGTTASAGLGSGPDPTPTPLCSPRTRGRRFLSFLPFLLPPPPPAWGFYFYHKNIICPHLKNKIKW